jgi:site-specific recombinase
MGHNCHMATHELTDSAEFSHPADLPALLATLNPEAPLAVRHLWLIAMVQWLRGDARSVSAVLGRLQLLLDAVQARPAVQSLWQRWWLQFTSEVDITPLLADHGFAPRTAFLSEFGYRLRRKLLPGTPETTDIGELFALLFDHPLDAQWLRAVDSPTLARARGLLFGPRLTPSPSWSATLMDAIVFATSQISSTGFAAEVRVRMSQQARQARTFQNLPPLLEALRQAVQQQGPGTAAVQAAAQGLREQLDACRQAAQTVYPHLEEHGISVGIVFRLRQLRERIVRIKLLLDALQSPDADRATLALLAELAQVSQNSRSLRDLVAKSAELTAAKVAERSAETGEHYITRNRAEYRQMLWQAAGGGAVIGLTTWAKFGLYALGLTAFWAGFAAGLNYAASFVLVQLLHFTVATKQPAVTAPAMVAKLRHIRAPRAVPAFVDEVAHLFRSQVAAIAGNLGLVVPVVLLISWALHGSTGHGMIDATTASHVLHDMNLLGPTALFAAFTGVLLFASSIVAGWAENWFVLHRLDSAMRYNPNITRWLGPQRANRWAGFMRRHISGFAANISLGLMLGLVPAFALFFGLDLQVRHVTLSAGQVAAAAVALGWESLATPGFWAAVAGVLVVGPINLGVSFYLAFRLALKAQNVGTVDRKRIRATILRRVQRHPLSFLLPPSTASRFETPHG